MSNQVGLAGPQGCSLFEELLFRLRPDLIVESGTWAGGSALFLAHMLDLMGNGQIVTVDVLSDADICEHYAQNLPGRQVRIRPPHPRITYLVGSSTDSTIIQQVKERALNRRQVLLIADSDHSAKHTYDELCAYHDLVTPGSYFIMEDTNIETNGPRSAVGRFLAEHPEFERDSECEKLFVTFNPGGFLRKKLPSPYSEQEAGVPSS
jgi:cephalosporin hydroxylase